MAARKRQAAAAGKAAALRVLLVDDSSLMRRILRGILETDPAFVVAGEAGDGVEALARLDVARPDIILLDIEMPRMDGIEFLRQARRRTAARVLVISSIAQPGTARALQALDLGAHDVMPKPSGVLSTDMATVSGRELLDSLHAIGGRYA